MVAALMAGVDCRFPSAVAGVARIAGVCHHQRNPHSFARHQTASKRAEPAAPHGGPATTSSPVAIGRHRGQRPLVVRTTAQVRTELLVTGWNLLVRPIQGIRPSPNRAVGPAGGRFALHPARPQSTSIGSGGQFDTLPWRSGDAASLPPPRNAADLTTSHAIPAGNPQHGHVLGLLNHAAGSSATSVLESPRSEVRVRRGAVTTYAPPPASSSPHQELRTQRQPAASGRRLEWEQANRLPRAHQPPSLSVRRTTGGVASNHPARQG